MKNILTVFLLLSLLVGSLLIPASQTRVLAEESFPGDTLYLLVQTQGPRQAVIDRVKALGGSVRFKYRNVPALAVALPAGQLHALSTANGVTKIEKDRLISLDETLHGKLNPLSENPFKVPSPKNARIIPLAAGDRAFQVLPQGIANTGYTGAQQVWGVTDSGAGSVVAVVDSGVAPNLCLSQALTGAPGSPNGYNAVKDGIPANSKANYWHGTFVAGVIASNCVYNTGDDDPFYKATHAFLPYPPDRIPIFGQAPGAKIYPVKVFPVSGTPTPSSVVIEGLDHILTLKKQGLLNINVVNLSFGTPTVYDGRDTMDRFINELIKANILVVAAAGNNGPVPNSLDSPATTFKGIAVGALDYPISSRVYYEYTGLTSGPNGIPYDKDEGPGMGMVMRPTDEVRVSNFSSRGPTSDGRGGPAISALGSWNLHLGPDNGLIWPVGGTSFAAPAVSGAAALLNAYWKIHTGEYPTVQSVRDALLAGADDQVVGQAWRDFNDQGFGALNIPQALEKLIAGAVIPAYPVNAGLLKPNVLGPPVQFKAEVYESQKVQVAPGEPFDAIFRIAWPTSKVKIEVFDIQARDNSTKARWPNALEVHLQGAMRSGFPHPLYFYWYPYKDANAFTIEVEDGHWTVDGLSFINEPLPLERGLMKLSLIGDFSNQDPISFKVRITRENNFKQTGVRMLNKEFVQGDEFEVPVQIAPGTSLAIFDLEWSRDWRFYPTSDIDMTLLDPNRIPVQLVREFPSSAPERRVIENPRPGTWTVVVEAIEAYKPDLVRLYVTLK